MKGKTPSRMRLGVLCRGLRGFTVRVTLRVVAGVGTAGDVAFAVHVFVHIGVEFHLGAAMLAEAFFFPVVPLLGFAGQEYSAHKQCFEGWRGVVRWVA